VKLPPHAILDHPVPVAFAHRGGAALFPESTLLAFERALELGCMALELDVHATRDRHLVVLHDSTVDRTTNGSGPVSSLTLSELQKLDAGYHFTKDGVTFPYRGQGLTVPSFEQLVRALPGANLNVELKVPGLAGLLLDSVKRHGLASRLVVAAFAHPIMMEFRHLAPWVPTSASRREAIGFRARTALRTSVLPPVFRALQIPPSYHRVPIITRATVSEAHRLGIAVHAWTIDDMDTMRTLLDLGVDGIMTDRPDVLVPLLAERDQNPLTGSKVR
jgi:glycerophosphoryl diester phosphodiesterase